MHNILVPIGVSKYAKTTLLYAIDVARHFESTWKGIDGHKLQKLLNTFQLNLKRLFIYSTSKCVSYGLGLFKYFF